MSKGKVFVQGDFMNAATKAVFVRYGYETTSDVPSADIIALTGGCDINPAIYGEDPVYSHGINKTRDAEDCAVIKAGLDGKKFFAGICRGAQLLNCFPNLGKLWQDVDLHGCRDHVCEDVLTGEHVSLNSLHHQMMREGPGAELVAFTRLSGVRRAEGLLIKGVQRDPEVIWYPKTRCLCFQSHPEFLHGPTTNYFFKLMERYYEGRKAILAVGRELVPIDIPPWEDTPGDVADAIARAAAVEDGCCDLDDLGEIVAVEEAAASCVDLPGEPA